MKAAVLPAPQKSSRLLPRQELFCQIYTSEQFGNATQAYIEAYGVDMKQGGSYSAARTSASRLLTNANILKRIAALTEKSVLSKEAVDNELAFLILQKANLTVKARAINEYNRVHGRTSKQQDHGIDEIRDMSDEELREKLSEIRKNREEATATN